MTTARRQAAISVSGLRSQNALLIFGEALEAKLAPADVRLVRAKGSSGVFAVDVDSDADLAHALADVPGFDVLSSVRPSARDSSLTLADVVAHEASEEPWSILEPPRRAARFAPPAGVAATSNVPGGGRLPAAESVTLTVHPMGSFRQVADFRDSLLEAPGVGGVTVSRFYRGSLILTVEYEDVMPLAVRLRNLDGLGSAEIVQQDDRSIDLAIGG